MNTITQASCHAPAPNRRGAWAMFLTILSVGRQKRALRALDDHLLADIGITRDQALAEAGKPVWQVPEYWR